MAMTVESIRKNIDKNKVKIQDLQRKNRDLEAQLLKVENEELFKVVKAVNLPNRVITELLRAYASGLIDLPEDIKELIEMEDEYEDISDRLSKNRKLKRIKICFGEVFPKGNWSRGVTADGSRAPEAALDFSEKCRGSFYFQQ